ncbi:unannotated protein [freshwater metagenome]|uniref:Unannotated protein n=1 Tax=freshwater metagenome TaxID=449393 RepID=A0A6J5YQ75_9ZZZZ|nr:hypothetical protein [Actinomycetota bacterium]
MTPPNKPEWIELAEADSAAQVKKSSRALPALVLAAAMSIVGLGALVAQNGAETPATASDQGANLSVASSPAQPSTPSAGASDNSSSAPNPSAVAQPNAMKQPSIASMPTGGGDDDDNEREGRGNHKDRGDDDDDEDEEGDEH